MDNITDSIFQIGSTHSICQDYAWHFAVGAFRGVALADGCSGAPDSDVGARILCRTAPAVIAAEWDLVRAGEWGTLGDKVAAAAQVVQENLHVAQHALDATLMIFMHNEDTNEAMIIAWGDGVIQVNDRQWLLSYKDNAPHYLSYSLNADRNAAYQETWDPKLCVNGLQATKPAPFTMFWDSAEDVQDVWLGSDGWETFYNDEGPLSIADVWKQATALKNLRGCYLRRRIQKMLKVNKDWGHGDDCALVNWRRPQ
jgi:hypothetical protein